MEDLLQEFWVENLPINGEFLENKIGKVKAGAPISEIVNGVQQPGVGALFNANNYIFGLIWENYSIYQFDSHSKNDNDNLSISCTAVYLKFDTLYSLESCVRSVYSNTFLLNLCSQLQFIKLHCTVNAKNAVKYELKKEY